MPEFATGGLIDRDTGEQGDIFPASLTGCTFWTSAERLSPNAQAFMLAAINAGTFPHPAEEAL